MAFDDDKLDTSLEVEMDSVGVMSFLNDEVDGVDVVYSIPMYPGVFIFELKDVTAGAREMTDNKTKEKVTRPSVAFSLEIVDVVKLAPGKDKPEDLEIFMGRRLSENIAQVGDMKQTEFLGRIKAFLVDMMGRGFSGTWVDLFEEAKGSQFRAEVKMRPDRNDKTVFYPTIVRGKKGDIVAV